MCTRTSTRMHVVTTRAHNQAHIFTGRRPIFSHTLRHIMCPLKVSPVQFILQQLLLGTTLCGGRHILRCLLDVII